MRLIAIVFLIPIILASAAAASKVKIASVSSEYTPTAGNELPEAVSQGSFSFEVNEETGRARIVVDYTYPDQPAFGVDGGPGPRPSIVQLPGLRYDAATKRIIYQDQAAGSRTVCATVHKARTIFWQRSIVQPTGACVVISRLADHTEDNGWRVRRFRAVDTFFEIR